MAIWDLYGKMVSFLVTEYYGNQGKKTLFFVRLMMLGVFLFKFVTISLYYTISEAEFTECIRLVMKLCNQVFVT